MNRTKQRIGLICYNAQEDSMIGGAQHNIYHRAAHRIPCTVHTAQKHITAQCNTLHTHHNTPKNITAHHSTLQHNTAHRTSYHIKTHNRTLLHIIAHYNTSQHTTTQHSTPHIIPHHNT